MVNRIADDDPRPTFELEEDSFGEAEKTIVQSAPIDMIEEEPDPDPTPSPEEVANKIRLASLSSLVMEKQPIAPVEPRAPSAKLPWILLAIFVVGGTYYHLHTVGSLGGAAATERKVEPSRTYLVQETTAESSSFLAAGYIAARVPITVGVTTSGRIREVRVSNGDAITKDQILAVLEDGQLQAELQLARAKERDAERALNRQKTLLKAQAATPTDVEKAVGQVEIARAERRVIAERLEQTRIRSPINGTVLEVLAHPGEVLTVAPDAIAGVVKVADLSDLVAEVDVNEGDIAKLRLGQDAEVYSDAQPNPTYAGKLQEIAQQADRARGTVLVRVDLPEIADGALKPGMAVKVKFLSGPHQPRILIPRGAVEGGVVSVIGSDGAISTRQVRTEPAGPKMLEVREGLAAGERIVLPPNAE